jgi:hypothetical protein
LKSREFSSTLIGIVGPCSAGKTTLLNNLQQHGFLARHIAQEHSFVPDMWRKLVNPRFLIYLDVSYPISMYRRPLDMTEAEFSEQVSRLEHARNNAHIYINTDNLSPDEVLERTLDLLSEFNHDSGA